MSDTSQGPGWWQASDHKWYPPDETPGEPIPAPPADPFATANESGAAIGSAFSIDLKRLTRGQLISAICTIVLFFSLFFPWYTYNTGFGSLSMNGLGHGWMYLCLILCIAIVAGFVLRAGFASQPFQLPLPLEQILLIATGINGILALLGFLVKPGDFGGIGWGIGAFLGLITGVLAIVALVVPALNTTTSAN